LKYKIYEGVSVIERSNFQIKKCKCSIRISAKKKHGKGVTKRRVTTRYMVVRLDGTHDMHTHIRSMFGSKKLIELILKGKMPMNSYLNESARRILTEEEFNSLELNEEYIYGYKENNEDKRYCIAI